MYENGNIILNWVYKIMLLNKDNIIYLNTILGYCKTTANVTIIIIIHKIDMLQNVHLLTSLIV